MSEDQSDRGENLLSRLKSPVRIAVLGPRRSGKSSLLNVLAGSRVLPDGKPLPTLQLTWGERAETTCIYGDGTRRQFTDAKPQDLVSMSPIFIEMRRRLPALRTVALLEVVMDGTESQKSRALAWASQRCDLALWCTALFDHEEQELWKQMPAALQAHATLVLTRADKFATTEEIADRLTSLGAAAAGRFRDIRPLAALQALSAFHADGSAETAILQRSGAQALIGSLLSEVEKGRTAVRTAAEALLDEMATPALPEGVTLVEEDAADPSVPGDGEIDLDEVADAVSDAEVASAPVPIGKPKLSLVSTTPTPPSDAADEAPEPLVLPAAAEVEPAPYDPPMVDIQDVPAAVPEEAQVAEAQAAAAGPPGHDLSPEGRDALESVVSYLTDRAVEMREMLDESDSAATGEMMTALLDDANWLADYLTSPFHKDDEIISDTRDVALDIADLIQLMELEQSITAAADATCLMLQVKRDIQALLAA